VFVYTVLPSADAVAEKSSDMTIIAAIMALFARALFGRLIVVSPFPF